MSSPEPKPEEVEETEEEIEDLEDEDFEDADEDEEMEEGEIGDEYYDEGIDIGELLSATLATEEGDTVCSALVTIGEQLATQNKILLKILSTLAKKDN